MKSNSDPIRQVWQGASSDLFLLSQVSHAFGVLPVALRDEPTELTVWFPDYFCNGSLARLRGSGAEIGFYPIGSDFKPDWAACRAMAEQGPPDVFVLVHYLGSRGDLEAARAFCNEIGAKLLEDATQLLRPECGIGSLGDFVCFGPRKFFDIPDGGLLVVRDPDDARRVAEALRRIPQRAPSSIRWRVKRARRAARNRLGLGRKPVLPLTPRRLDDVRPEPQPFSEAFMSATARERLSLALRAGWIDEIARQRLRYEDAVREFVRNLDGVSPLDKPSDAIACWVGLECKDPGHAQTALDGLRALGFPALPWPNQLPPEILGRDAHARAVALRNTTLIVPFARLPQS